MLREHSLFMATHQKNQSTDEQQYEHNVKHLHEVLESFDTVLLGTYEHTGPQPSLRSRPMSVAKLEPDCSMWFITEVSTDKVEEAELVRTAHVFGQEKTRYLSMRGWVDVSQDRAKLKELWNPWAQVWFSGPDDPRAALMLFTPDEAEIWDSKGVKGLAFLFKAARGLLGGKPPKGEDETQHAKVQLR
jgi:general stress protein 26